MTEEELTAFASWLRQTQGIEMEPAALREAAGAAVRLGAQVGAAAQDLPFGAEPSGFNIAIAKLAGGDNDAG